MFRYAKVTGEVVNFLIDMRIPTNSSREEIENAEKIITETIEFRVEKCVIKLDTSELALRVNTGLKKWEHGPIRRLITNEVHVAAKESVLRAESYLLMRSIERESEG